MKYFFLTEGWRTGRVWEFGGLWNEVAWRRPPIIQQLQLSIWEQGERLWLYQVEDDVLMVEVIPPSSQSDTAIGQVVLKRLMSADLAISMLASMQGNEADAQSEETEGKAP